MKYYVTFFIKNNTTLVDFVNHHWQLKMKKMTKISNSKLNVFTDIN